MKIVQWAFPYFPSVGGREVFIRRLSEGLGVAHDDVLLIAPAIESDDPLLDILTNGPVTTVRVNARPNHGSGSQGTWNSLTSELTALVKDFGGNVLHFHRPDGLNVFLLRELLVRSQIPAVFTSHGPFMSDSGVRRERINKVLSMCEAVVSISPGIYEQVEKVLPEGLPEHHLIPNGVPERAPVYGPRRGPDVFAFGRLSGEKGFQVLIQAIGLLRQSGHVLTVVIAGSGPFQEELEAMSHELGVDDAVEFPGWLDDGQIAHYLDSSKTVVVPSLWEEPFGLVAAEAMMAGNVVVTSDQGFLPEAIRHGQTGFVVPAGNAEALAEILLRSVALDAEERDAFAEAAHLDALERFSQTRWLSDYRVLYEKVGA